MRMANGDDTFSLTSFQALPAGRRQRAAMGASVPNIGSCRLAGKMPTPHNDLAVRPVQIRNTCRTTPAGTAAWQARKRYNNLILKSTVQRARQFHKRLSRVSKNTLGVGRLARKETARGRVHRPGRWISYNRKPIIMTTTQRRTGINQSTDSTDSTDFVSMRKLAGVLFFSSLIVVCCKRPQRTRINCHTSSRHQYPVRRHGIGI